MSAQGQDSPIGEKPHDLMRFFKFDHLSDEAQVIGQDFFFAATAVDRSLPNESNEKRLALVNLIQARDWALRGFQNA